MARSRNPFSLSVNIIFESIIKHFCYLEMYKSVQYQMILMHATFLFVGGWAGLIWIFELLIYHNIASSFGIEGSVLSVLPGFVPDQLIFLFSLMFILKAVSILLSS